MTFATARSFPGSLATRWNIALVRDWGPYPPWWLARAAERRIELERAVERIRTVVRESDDIVGLRYARLVNRLELGVPCDLIVYEPEEFERLSIERAFVAQARREGIWIDATPPA